MKKHTWFLAVVLAASAALSAAAATPTPPPPAPDCDTVLPTFEVPDRDGDHRRCQFFGPGACESCLAYWAGQGNGMHNHFCKDKSRAAGTRGWDCFNYVEDTSHGYECIAYCPPETATCVSNCDQRKRDGSACHDHPLRKTRNKHTGRVLGPPGSAPEKNKGLEQRNSCNW